MSRLKCAIRNCDVTVNVRSWQWGDPDTRIDLCDPHSTLLSVAYPWVRPNPKAIRRRIEATLKHRPLAPNPASPSKGSQPHSAEGGRDE